MRLWLGTVLILAGGQDPALVRTIDDAARAVTGFRGETPARRVDDAAFLRRLSRDLVDLVPSTAEIRDFEADPDPKKRLRKIDQFLASERFAAFWARRWMTTFFGRPDDGSYHSWLPARPKPGAPVDCSFSPEPDASLPSNRQPRWVDRVTMEQVPGLSRSARDRMLQNFERWLREQIRKDRPWTEVVSDLIAARGKTEEKPELAYKLSFFRGKGYPLEFAQGAARHFLGVRLYCAGCHDHPFDQWSIDDLYRLGAFAAREKASAYGGYGEKSRHHAELSVEKKGELAAPGGAAAVPVFILGGQAGADDDRTAVLAKLMTAKGNLQFARILVNRVWAWLLGSGLVEPVDAFDLRNKPLSRPAMDALARAAADNATSIKFLVRTLCSTELYQRVGEDVRDASGEWVWRGTVRRAATWTPLPRLRKDQEKPLPVSVEVPAPWSPVAPERKALARWHVPVRKAEWPADFYLVSYGVKPVLKNFVDTWLRQVGERKTKEETLDEAGKITLTEVSGKLWCDARAAEPWDFLLLAGVVETAGGAAFFRLEGPAETVREWRGEFLDLLKRAK